MSCKIINEALFEQSRVDWKESLNPAALEHIRTCKNCSRLIEVLDRSSHSPALDPDVISRITGSLLTSIRPVRPLPSAAYIAWGLFAVCLLMALAGALRLGMYGVRALSPGQCLVIFVPLSVLAGMAATLSSSEMVPGAKHRIHPSRLLLLSVVILVPLFAFLFRDYSTFSFVARGLGCLRAGLLVAMVAAVLTWLLLRRGFAVSPVAAGLAVGTLAGFAGIGMLELHCPILNAMHVMVWHVAVLPLSALAGASIAKLFSLRAQ